MDAKTYCLYVLVMAGVTYLIRAIPLTLFQRRLNSPFIRSFLYYVPYAVLGAMTFPDVFTSAGAPAPSLLGTAAALLLACRGKSMVVVALGACAAALCASLVLMLI